METTSSVASSLREGTPQGEDADQNLTAGVSLPSANTDAQNPNEFDFANPQGGGASTINVPPENGEPDLDNSNVNSSKPGTPPNYLLILRLLEETTPISKN
jgi:hypothetical protein